MQIFTKGLPQVFWRLPKQNMNHGFSLVELMIAISLAGIVVLIGIPRFQAFQANSRQGEAKANLTHAWTLEEIYYSDEEHYAQVLPIGAQKQGTVKCGKSNLNKIGFRPVPCHKTKTRYLYYTTFTSSNRFTFEAKAGKGSIFAHCNVQDTWTMDQDRVLRSAPGLNAIRQCTN